MTGGAAPTTASWRDGRWRYADASHTPSEWIAKRTREGEPPPTRRVLLAVWLLRTPEWRALRATSRHVLFAIIGHADAKGRSARVAYSELALETGLSESTVIAAVADLERGGWLAVVRERVPGQPRSKVNVYTVRYPGEAGRTHAAIERTLKEGPGARATDLVRPHDLYQTADGKWKVRKAFIHVWELGSQEWQAMFRSEWAVDVTLTLRASAIAGEVSMSRRRIAEILERVLASAATPRLRVLEALQGVIKLGLLKLKRAGGPKGHTANVYTPSAPPSCAAWEAYFIGSAPSGKAAPTDAAPENVKPVAENVKPVAEVPAPPQPMTGGVIRLVGVTVPFRPSPAVDPAAICPICAREARLPRAVQVRTGAPEEWYGAYCQGRHVEPIVAGCPGCGTALTTPEGAFAHAEAKREGREPGPMVAVDAQFGTVWCSQCDVKHRYAEPMRYRPFSGELIDDEPWRPLDGAALVRAWLDGRRTPREPTPNEAALAGALVAELGDWWAARDRVCTTWRSLDSRDVRFLTGLAARTGYKRPDTS